MPTAPIENPKLIECESENDGWPTNKPEGCINFPPLHIPPSKVQPILKRPWKDIYAERSVVERNWRKPFFTYKILEGKLLYFIQDTMMG